MRIWLFYADVGGGHRTAAKAIAEEFHRQYAGQVESVLINATAESPRWAKQVLESGYEWLISRAHWLWKILYFISKWRPIMRAENALFSITLRRQVKRRLYAEPLPEKIVAFFYLVGPILHELRRRRLSIPVIVAVTDPFTVPPIWFYYRSLSYIVFSEQAWRIGTHAGVAPERIRTRPWIIDQKFLTDPNEYAIAEFKRVYKIPARQPVVLIAGGGQGLPKGDLVLKALVESDIDATLIMVCGRNQAQAKAAERIKKHTRKKVIVFGFVDFMNILIAISDVVVTKGGPAMVMETLALRKPLILTHYTWEQEKGNVEFVVDHEVGYYVPEPAEVPVRVRELLYDERVKERFSQRLSEVTIENGAAAIAEHIYRAI